MKIKTKFLLALVLVLLPAAASAQATAWTEDFNCADSATITCDLTWTKTGSPEIKSNKLQNSISSYGHDMAIAQADSLGSVNQWLLATWTYTPTTQYAEWILRYTNSSSPHYGVVFYANEQLVQWRSYATAGGSPTGISSTTALTIASGDAFGVTVDGTGASTVVRIWKNPTGTPSSSSNWNGDTTPDVTFTDDPGTAANTGTYAGFALFGSAAYNSAVDDASAGRTDGGGSTPKCPQMLGVWSCDAEIAFAKWYARFLSPVRTLERVQ